MIPLVFLVVAAMFAVAGTFISLEAKRRNDSPSPRPMVIHRNTPNAIRTSSDRGSEADTGARAA
jgi:hypothetical protein